MSDLPANLSRYSMVNQVMQTASTMANFGLSAGFPSSSTMPTDGMVLTVMAAVDSTTNVMEMMLTIWNKYHHIFWKVSVTEK